jgi:hypothetical protein
VQQHIERNTEHDGSPDLVQQKIHRVDAQSDRGHDDEYQGLSDQTIAKQNGLARQRSVTALILREKKQAKVYLAILSCLKSSVRQEGEIIR